MTATPARPPPGIPATVLLACCIALASGFPVDKQSKGSAFFYLVNYGYIHRSGNSTAQLLSDEAVTKAIMDFQAFAGLQQTGELDDDTVELMNTPRCGVKDNVGPSTSARRKKRYALQGSRWKVTHLTYKISQYPSSPRLTTELIDQELKSAFKLWQDSTGLTFEQKQSGSVHIDIRFASGEHGDGDPFDGPGGTLAHAFFPQFGGDAHFDDDEYWTINDFRGTNLRQAAAHEFGHSLGLSHSDVRAALMAPFYRGWDPNLSLDQDDIQAIQALYGRRAQVSTEDDHTPGPPAATGTSGAVNNRDLCSGRPFDLIVGTHDQSYYVFQGANYWKLNEDSVEAGYPRPIATDWQGLPDNLDTAVTWPDNGKTYFFKGAHYWKFTNQEPAPGYPKLISEGFSGIPDNLDAAFVWGGNGKIYFIKGSNYWKFDPNKEEPVKRGYPKDISNWELSPTIQSAVQWSNKYTYFFKDGQYYRFDDRRFTIDRGDPPFPRPTGKWWFGCPETRSLLGQHAGGDDDRLFETRALRKSEASSGPAFTEEGDELLDVAQD